MTSLARRSVLGAVTVLAAAGALALAGCGKKSAGALDLSQDMSLGAAGAPVTVIEYASVTCPHCAAWNEEVFPGFKKAFIDTGKVHYVLREFPVHPAPDAAGFLLARCAGKDKYFTVVDAIMRAQPEMVGPSGGLDNLRPVYLTIARSAGMNEEQFNACIQNEANLKAFNDRWQREAKEFDVGGTPTFVINGVKQDWTAPPTMEEISAAINAAPAKK